MHVLSESIKISAISYLNTRPFLYGIKKSDFLSKHHLLSIDTPSACADKLLRGEVDLGIVPVALLPSLEKYHILTQYCIGCVGEVVSVMLYSEVPITQIQSVYLDYQSKTSIALVRLLAEQYWNIYPRWIPATTGYEKSITGNTAGVVIGDRTFDLNGRFPYEYDLGKAWYAHTGLPFVFACWVANRDLPADFVMEFNKAIQFGVDNRNDVVEELSPQYPFIDEYLNKNISYHLDEKKREGMDLFLTYCNASRVANFVQ